jgi:integrase
MALTPIAAKNAKPQAKPYKLTDGGGLYLEIFPNGSKLWRLKYRKAGGKETRVSLGKFPAVTVAEARIERERIKAGRRDGIDPANHRRQAKAIAAVAAENTFAAVAKEWASKQRHAPSTSSKLEWVFDTILNPGIGMRPIGEVSAPELLAVLRRVESRGKLETAQRAKQYAGLVFRYAIATGRADRDPAADLKGALATPKTRHRASLTAPTTITPLLRAIDGCEGSAVVAAALRLAPLVFVRPGELRGAEWREFDFDAAEWRISAERMKGRTGERVPHLVPLSTQAIAVLNELLPITGRGRYVFPSIRTGSKPISENTLNAALRRLGFTATEMTAHGFRSMASTRLHEMGWPHAAIERQLAHVPRDKVSAAYNYAEHLPERRKMMQAWADYLDRLRDGGNVIAGSFGRVA